MAIDFDKRSRQIANEIRQTIETLNDLMLKAKSYNMVVELKPHKFKNCAFDVEIIKRM